MRIFPIEGALGSTLRQPPSEPVPVRDAATVMLVRDGDRGVEVFVFRRVRGMAFAAGMVVFPGGAVDPPDADPGVTWVSGPPTAVEPAVAVAAVRETFEECGVLLAAGAGPLDGDRLAALREDLVAGRVRFPDVLAELRLALDARLLHPWAHWLTPEVEPRRYDTRFFVARVPDGQEPRDLGGEGENARWVLAADALAQAQAGQLGLMPPTQVCLEDLVDAGSVASLFATARTLRRITPRVEEHRQPDGTTVRVLTADVDGSGR